MKKLTAVAGVVLGLAGGFGSFVYAQEAKQVPAAIKAVPAPVTQAGVLENYANIVYASYDDSLTLAKVLQAKLAAFTANPTEATLADAKAAWLASREPYLQTEAYRFYSGPIDDDKGPEGLINAWPLDEAYIDYVKGKPNAGIVNNPKLKIDAKTLLAANERGGEANISTGYHAIEFLLWGQDFSKTGPGNRAYTDFVDGSTKNADRRREYLNVAAALLVEHLTYLRDAWAPNAQNYRATFVADKGGLRKVLVGAGVLSRAELAGERMEVALDSKNQEDEHSCFSDNTHRDAVGDAQGIQNVWLGSYKRIDGTVVSGASLEQLVAQSNPAIAAQMTRDVASTMEKVQQIKAPFDQELVNKDGQARIRATVTALKKQAATLVQAAKAIGISKLNTQG